jgi:hypothetical protein
VVVRIVPWIKQKHLPRVACRPPSGTPISPEDVDVVYEGHLMRLTDGRCFSLAGGNAAYAGDGKWFRNGKPWNIQPHEKVRPLPSA